MVDRCDTAFEGFKQPRTSQATNAAVGNDTIGHQWNWQILINIERIKAKAKNRALSRAKNSLTRHSHHPL